MSKNKIVLDLIEWANLASYISVGNYLNCCSNSELEEFQLMQYIYLKNLSQTSFDANYKDYVRIVAILYQCETSDAFDHAQLANACKWFIDMVAVEKYIRQSGIKNKLTEKFHKYATISDYQNFVEDLRKTQK